MARVGLLGGTFDPVHNGHLQIASLVLEHCRLDTILFVPAAHPPHKDKHLVCDIDHRLNMLRRATKSDKQFQISEIETDRDSLSYTIDTVEKLKNTSGDDTVYYFILGFDALIEIETWHRWQDLLQTTNFIVAVRPGFSLKEVEQILTRNGFSSDQADNDRWVCEKFGNEVLFLGETIDDISSTTIRARIAADELWQGLVPSVVADYISRNNLYVN